VGSFVKGSSVSRKSGALLFRIARWLQPEMIIELGTGLGISTLYLARGYAGADVTSFEGNRERAAFAAQLFCRSHMDNISIHWGELDGKLEDFLPQIRGRVLAFMDANHRYLPSLGYARKLMDHAGEDSIIIMDDIYWSRDMYRAWQEIISWTEVRMSIDLFHMGVLILRKDLQKNDVKINL
jgi:predicted O-methyltransferase YrrM